LWGDCPAIRTPPSEDFLWLLLQHVLPNGLQRVRDFGVLQHNARRTLALVQVTQAAPSRVDAAPTRPTWLCACGQPMVIVRRRMRPTSSAPGCTTPQIFQTDKANSLEAITH
jgi:hypothetical protein